MAEYVVSFNLDYDGTWKISTKERIVRCRDCYYFSKGEFCRLYAEDAEDGLFTEPDDFCSSGLMHERFA